MTRILRWRRSARLASILALASLGATGCGALDVSDPTAIEESELDNADGAQLLRTDALRRFAIATSDGTLIAALLSDEYFSNPPSYLAPGTYWEEILDRRQSEVYEQLSYAGPEYSDWHEVRRATTVAIPKLRAFARDGQREAQIGEMYAARGYAAMRLAEDICPGFPLHEVNGLTIVYGTPRTTAQVFERALADFDSAIAIAADSARVVNFAKVARGRALLGLGNYADAAAAVAGVPTDFERLAEYSASEYNMRNSAIPDDNPMRGVGDGEGGVGLDYISANDPRLPTDTVGTATDGVTTMFGATKLIAPDAPIVVASGTEARLIEAEAAYRAGSPQWIAILNQLRSDRVAPSFATLVSPPTEAAQVDLLFRERAFWLFGTGHRLADLRRLVAQYGREAESVYPTGAYRLGGGYSTATSVPFPAADEIPFSPTVTGCTSR